MIGRALNSLAIALQADALLRGRIDPAPSGKTPRTLAFLFGTIALCGCLYGATMGTSEGVAHGRLLQVLYSAMKVPMLMMITLALSLPSFFVLNTLLGLRADFRYVLKALLSTQAASTVILASLAPLTAFWYVSVHSSQAAILFNAVMFGLASISSQFVLYRAYRPLIARKRAHLKMFRLWIFAYAFVGIQMGWVLRPFVGNPYSPTEFFRSGAWGNAYIEVVRIARQGAGW